MVSTVLMDGRMLSYDGQVHWKTQSNAGDSDIIIHMLINVYDENKYGLK